MTKSIYSDYCNPCFVLFVLMQTHSHHSHTQPFSCSDTFIFPSCTTWSRLEFVPHLGAFLTAPKIPIAALYLPGLEPNRRKMEHFWSHRDNFGDLCKKSRTANAVWFHPRRSFKWHPSLPSVCVLCQTTKHKSTCLLLQHRQIDAGETSRPFYFTGKPEDNTASCCLQQVGMILQIYWHE